MADVTDKNTEKSLNDSMESFQKNTMLRERLKGWQQEFKSMSGRVTKKNIKDLHKSDLIDELAILSNEGKTLLHTVIQDHDIRKFHDLTKDISVTVLHASSLILDKLEMEFADFVPQAKHLTQMTAIEALREFDGTIELTKELLIEEKRRRKEEKRRQQEKERQLEEEAHWQEDKKNWNDYVYEVENQEHEEGADHESEIICIACVHKDEPFHKEDIECKYVDPMYSSFSPQKNQELVNNIICISGSKNRKLKFQKPIRISFPYSVPHDPCREIALFASKNKEPWKELNSKETNLNSIQKQNFVETQMKTVSSLEVAAVSRWKRDSETFTKKGGSLTSSVDPNVHVVVPKSSFEKINTVQLEIQPVDKATFHEVKKRKSESAKVEDLVATSHIIHVQSESQPKKPLQILLPNPERGYIPQPVNALSRKKHSSTSTSESVIYKRNGQVEQDCLYLAKKTPAGTWIHVPKTPVKIKRNQVALELESQKDRLLLLRIKGDKPDAIEVQEIAKQVEESITKKSANIILRQKSVDMAEVYVECCRTKTTEKNEDKMRKYGFDAGPAPSLDFRCTEGQKIFLTFEGNLNFAEDTDIQQQGQLVFYSHLSSRRQFFIDVVNPSAQCGYDIYRGYAQFHLSTETSLAEATSDGKKLCDLPVTMPKKAWRMRKRKKAPFLPRDEGLLDSEYFDDLTTKLGVEWTDLGLLLIRPSQLEAIRGNYPEQCDDMKWDMLIEWYKGSAVTANKVAELIRALIEVNRNDLADELRERTDRYMDKIRQNIEDDRFMTAFKMVEESSVILQKWKMFLRDLGVPDHEVEIINHENANIQEKLHNGLVKWRSMKGKRATRNSLMEILKTNNDNKTAEQIRRIDNPN